MAKNKKNKDRRVEVELLFKAKVIIRDDFDLEKLIKEETYFMTEPQSANGCVMSMKLKNINKN